MYINDPESLVGPIILGLAGLWCIFIVSWYLRNQARGTAKTERSVSLGRRGQHAVIEAHGIANVLYAPDKKHTNTEEQFLGEVARFGASEMDKIGSNKKINGINIWVEGMILLQNYSVALAWKGVRLNSE